MIEVRPLTQHAEFAEAVQLQQTIWGFEEIELLPVRLFVTATKVGGQAFGGFDGGRMIGFCAWTMVTAGPPVSPGRAPAMNCPPRTRMGSSSAVGAFCVEHAPTSASASASPSPRPKRRFIAAP